MNALLAAFLLHLCTWSQTRAVNCPDSRCSCTEQAISCSGIGLNKVPDFSVDKLVTFLILDNNDITNISSNAFANLPQLTTLSIQNNPLSNIDGAAFAANQQINHLMLSGSQNPPTGTINVTNIVSQLPKLSWLEIAKLNVKTLYPNFASSTSITKLTLDTCNIGSIEDNAFQSVPNLVKLLLPNNMWGTSNAKLLQWLKPLVNVNYLDFTNCVLTNIMSAVPKLPKLQTLILARNQLTLLSADSLNNIQSSLQVLDVSFNKDLSDIQVALPSLQQLNLDSNTAMSVLPQSIANMRSLLKLNLDHTHITSLNGDSLPASLNELTMLSCSRLNYIDTKSFAKTPQLTKLYIEEIDFKNVRADWSGLLEYTGMLKTLYLSPTIDAKETLNSSIWDVIQAMTKLEELSLMNNQLNTVPDFVLINLKKLRVLNLANINLTKISFAKFFGPQALTDVYLEDNQLSTFDNCSFANFNNLTTVSLRGNPLSCECGMRWLRILWKNNSNMLNNLNCKGENITWSQKEANQFCTEQDAAKLPTCSIQTPPVDQPLYNIPVQFTQSASNQVRVDINVSQQLQKLFVNWFVEYGVQNSNTKVQSYPPSGLTAFILVNFTKDNSEASMLFCPVLTFISNETYRHPSYCRLLAGISPNSSISAAIIGGVITGVLIVLIVVVILAVVCTLRVRRRKILKANEEDHSNVTEEEDPYAYAVPETVGATKLKRETISVVEPRNRTTSKTFSRAKSQDDHLNEPPRHSNDTMASSRAPLHHRSTPHILAKDQSNSRHQSGQTNTAFINSATSLHHNSNFGDRISAASSGARGYPTAHQQRQVNSQPLPPRNREQREGLCRSADNLAERSLPSAPTNRRTVNSAEIILDPRRAQRNYKEAEQMYEHMTDNRDGAIEFNNNETFLTMENSYGPSPSLEIVPTRVQRLPSNYSPQTNSQSIDIDIDNSYFEMGRF